MQWHHKLDYGTRLRPGQHLAPEAAPPAAALAASYASLAACKASPSLSQMPALRSSSHDGYMSNARHITSTCDDDVATK